MEDKTFYFYLSRKQIIVVAYDAENGKTISHHRRTERGFDAAQRRMRRLQDAGYTRVEQPRDWFSDLLADIRATPAQPAGE